MTVRERLEEIANRTDEEMWDMVMTQAQRDNRIIARVLLELLED